MPLDDLNSLNFDKKIKAKFKNKEKLRQEIHKGKSAQELLGVTKKQMSLLYQAARLFLDRGKFQDAANAFLFLATLKPKEGDYWLGLGEALANKGEIDGARDAFELATLCGADNPLPYLHLAKALFSIGDREATLEALEWTLQLANDHDQYASIKKEALKAKKLLES